MYTLDPHELCCGVNAYAQTAGAESFELKKVGDGVWAAVAAARYKVNSNAAVIETNDGLVVVDTHSKPSAAQALYKDIQGVSKKPVKKIINSHFHWDHWQGNQVYAQANPGCEIIASERTKARLTDPNQMKAAWPSSRSRPRPCPPRSSRSRPPSRRRPTPRPKPGSRGTSPRPRHTWPSSRP